MTHSFNTSIKNWLNAVFDEQKISPVQVFETNNADNKARIVSDLAKQKKLRVFSFQFKAETVSDPLYMIHRIITAYRTDFGDEFIEALIEQHVYSSHKIIFRNWLNEKSYYRHETLLWDESGYEQFEFHIAIGRLLASLAAKQKFLVIINNIQSAPYFIIELFNRFIDRQSSSIGYGIVAFVPGQKTLMHQSNNSKWPECLNQLERTGLILPLEDEAQKTIKDAFWDKPQQIRKFDKQFKMLTAAADLFAYNDVVQMVEMIRLEASAEETGRLFFLSGFSLLMTDQIDAAIRDFSASLNRLQASPSESILMAVNYWLAICFAIQGREKLARANQEQLEKLAVDYGNQRWYVLSLFTSFYVNSRITQHLLTISDIEALKFLLRSVNYDNLLCSLLSQVFNTGSSRTFASPRALLSNCVTSLRIARRHKNIFAFSTALQAMGICHSRLGNNSQTSRLFLISLQLREKFQRKANLIHMLNGLGYHFIGLEKWTEAWNYFDTALKNLIEIRNYTELTITLYNYAWLYSQSGHYAWAIEILNDLLELMRIRSTETLPFRNLKDIYTYKGWLHIQSGQPIQAQYCLMRYQKLTHLHSTSFSLAVEQLVACSLAKHNDNPAQALKHLGLGVKYIENIDDVDQYMLSVLQLEIGRLFKALGYEEKAKEIFDQLRVRAQKASFTALAQRTSRASLGLALAEPATLPTIKRPYQLLMDIAQKESRVIELQSQISDLHQANLLIELSTEEATIEGFLMKVIEVLNRRIPANHLMVMLSDPLNSNEVIEVNNGIPPEVAKLYLDYLSDKTFFKSMLSFDSALDVVMAWPLNMKASSHAWLIVSGDENQSLVWNKDYLQLVSVQLGLVLDRRLREDLLEQQNRTDMLTGILNRSGLFERMTKLFSHMQRNPTEPLTICYFDLDHFKYFNDHYGHEQGDKVLGALTDLVNANLRGSDEFGRLGGDEFILMLSGTGRKEAKHILNRIRTEIERPDWWLSLFDLADQSENPIAKENWITASFGAVVVNRWPKNGLDRIELLAQADELMYKAKDEGRNKLCIEDIVDTGE